MIGTSRVFGFLTFLLCLGFCTSAPAEQSLSNASRYSTMPPENDADGDGIPDAEDEHPLVADNYDLTWTISEMTAGWKVIQGGTITEKQTSGVARDVTRTFGTKVDTGIETKGVLSFNPLKWFGHEARVRVEASGGIALSREDRESAGEFRETVSSATFKDPFVEFTVIFVNRGAAAFTARDLSIPIMVGNQELAAAVFTDHRAGATEFTIPARRPSGVPFKFRAELDNTNALRLLEHIAQGRSPSFRVDIARGTIEAKVGDIQVDAIALAQETSARTVGVTMIHPNGHPITWRVAKAFKGENVTLHRAAEAINKCYAPLSDGKPVFHFDQKGTLVSAGGIDNQGGDRWRVTSNGQEMRADEILRHDVEIVFDTFQPTTQTVAGVENKPVENPNAPPTRLAITGEAPANRYVGNFIPYTIEVRNAGNASAENVMVELVLPDGVTLDHAGEGGQLRGSTVVWTFPNLAPNETKRLLARVVAERIMNVRAAATAKAENAGEVSASLIITDVAGIAALLGTLVDINDPVPVGENEIYEITIENVAKLPATGIRLKAIMPQGYMQFVKASGPTEVSPVRSNEITFDPLAALNPGAEAKWRIEVKAIKAGDIRFKIVYESDQLERPVTIDESTHLYE